MVVRDGTRIYRSVCQITLNDQFTDNTEVLIHSYLLICYRIFDGSSSQVFFRQYIDVRSAAHYSISDNLFLQQGV